MNILVTGGSGFIGSTLVDRLLAEGNQIEVVDDLSTGSLVNLSEARAEQSGDLRIHQASVLDEAFADLVRHRAPEVIVHLAGATAKADRASRPQLRVDVEGTLAVLEAAAEIGCRKVVWTPSARAQHDPMRGVADRAILEYVRAFEATRGLASTTIVLPSVYGPRQTTRTESCVVAVFVERALRGERCVVHGDGAQTRDVLFVDDVVDALVRSLDRGDGETVELGTGAQVRVRDLHDAVMRAAGVDAPPPASGDRRPGEPGSVPVDPARAGLVLGWQSWTTLEAGLERTVETARRAREQR